MRYNLNMDVHTNKETAIALIHGDQEYAELLQDFVRVEKDKEFKISKMAREFLEKKRRGTI